MKYKTIKKLVLGNQYRARLFKLIPIGKNQVQIKIYKLKNKGQSTFDTHVESVLKPISLNTPRNGFERGILESYSRCREEGLERYFPYLDKRDIEVLLRDNYLQTKDLKRVFKHKHNTYKDF